MGSKWRRLTLVDWSNLALESSDVPMHIGGIAILDGAGFQQPAGADESDLLETAAKLLEPLLDRAHPLWELWFLTGLAGSRVAMLFKLHHAVADGLAAVALVG